MKYEIETFAESDFVVTWGDGSALHYKTLFDALESIKRDWENHFREFLKNGK